jgi:hypothetical protein
VELTEEAESSMIQSCPALSGQGDGLTGGENKPVQFFKFKPIKSSAKDQSSA